MRLGNTSVVCGVRAEILNCDDIPGTHDVEDAAQADDESSDEISSLRLVVPNVELSTGSTPAHIPGNAPSTLAQSLITRIRSLLLSTRILSASDLRITYTPTMNPEDADEAPREEVKGYWVLYIDVFFISIDGAAFDAAWISILAALRDTKLPRAWFDEEFEGILCSDDPAETKALDLRCLPVPATFAVFEGKSEEGDTVQWTLSDPDAFEEAVCGESVCMVVDEGGKVVRRIEKSGGGVVGREEMKQLVRRAGERWKEVDGALK